MIPAVNITELDGALGVLPSNGTYYAVVGPATAGPLNTPAGFASIKSLTTEHGTGPAVELAAQAIALHGKPVVFVRATADTAGTTTDLDETGVIGTSVVTIGTATANDDYEVRVKVITGGTIGVTGITLAWSLDGGRTYSPPAALGVATSYAIPGAGGLSFAFAAGTLVANDVFTARAKAPACTGANVTTALTALQNSNLAWEIVALASAVDGTIFDAVANGLLAMFAAGKDRAFHAHFRIPNVGETEAAYKTAFDAAFGAKASSYGAVYAGGGELVSAVNGRAYLRSLMHRAGPLEAAQKAHINVADIDVGRLTGFGIRDANGNPKHHDEAVNPGLDDSRATVARTHEGYSGVYVNQPRLLSEAGSDFQLMPHRRVMNRVHAALRVYFKRRLSKPVRVDRKTGFIREDEAREIEAGATAAVSAAVGQEPMVSAVIPFALSRTDNVLSTNTLTGSQRIVPLAYPTTFNVEVGYFNPALAVQVS